VKTPPVGGKISDGSMGLKRMPDTVWQGGKWLRAAFAGALVLTLTIPAVAADDEVEDTVDTKFMKGFLTNLGLQPDNREGIDYHERSPLVVPPTRELRPPQSAATITNNPAWPKDKDVANRKTAKKQQKILTEEEDMRPLRPDELRGAPSVQGRGVGGDPGNPNVTRAEQMTPQQLGHTGFTFSNVFNREGRQVQFTGEPPRTSLTEPPVGLRTPSARYPYGSKGVLEADKNGPRDQASYGTDR
jgi:hypothetical protein